MSRIGNAFWKVYDWKQTAFFFFFSFSREDRPAIAFQRNEVFHRDCESILRLLHISRNVLPEEKGETQKKGGRGEMSSWELKNWTKIWRWQVETCKTAKVKNYSCCRRNKRWVFIKAVLILVLRVFALALCRIRLLFCEHSNSLIQHQCKIALVNNIILKGGE